jgi:hypothetical protein
MESEARMNIQTRNAIPLTEILDRTAKFFLPKKNFPLITAHFAHIVSGRKEDSGNVTIGRARRQVAERTVMALF